MAANCTLSVQLMAANQCWSDRGRREIDLVDCSRFLLRILLSNSFGLLAVASSRTTSSSAASRGPLTSILR